MQQEQLNALKDITGVDFKFVPANKNKFGIKYYEYKCNTDTEYWDITGLLNEHDTIIYRCIEHPDKKCSVIILENKLDAKRYDNISEKHISNTDELKPIGKINGNDVFLEPILTLDNKCETIIVRGGRAITIVNINGHRLPFYVSSGASGKEQEYGIPSGKWYALQGISPRGWLNKMPDMMNNPYPELDQICNILEQKFPAAKLKNDALKNLLPIANDKELLDAANFGFPEGMPPSEYTNYTYIKNHCVYLPQIIDAWRSKPTDYLNIQNGILASQGQKILNKVQKMKLFCASKLDGDYIWFYPIEDNDYNYVKHFGVDTVQGIKNSLCNNGISGPFALNKKGVGVPLYALADYFVHRHQELEKASQKIRIKETKKLEKKETFQTMFRKFFGLSKD